MILMPESGSAVVKSQGHLGNAGTDEFQAYNAARATMPHAVIKHSERYADGETHTNTIEGFWSLLKRAWYGSHHHYRKHYTPLYVAEACWKYNHRKHDNAFGSFMRGCFA